MDSKKIGKYISNLRKSAGLTQEELAERIYVNSKTISKWETGVNVPDTIFLDKLSKEFNVSIQDILNGDIIKIQSNDNTFYCRRHKNKIIKILILLLTLLSIIISLFAIDNHNKYQLYDIVAEDKNYDIRGFLIRNNNEFVFILYNLAYYLDNSSVELEPYINQYSIQVKDADREIIYYSSSNKLDESFNLSDIINHKNIIFTSNNIVRNKKIKNLNLIFSYDYNGEYNEKVINLVLNKHVLNI